MNKDQLLEQAKHLKCELVDKVVDEDLVYGSYPDLDKMVDSGAVSNRIRIAKLGYGLDKLKDDTDPRVRAEVARHGVYNQKFIRDSSEIVRSIAKRA